MGGKLGRLRTAALLLLSMHLMANPAAANDVVRVGILKFGTVSWELDTIKHNRFDEKHGVEVDVRFFASEDATNVAMMAGDVDIIVSDWLWVSRQRASGVDLTMVPYSTAAGAVMVPENSSIRSLGDLRGHSLGVAGGPLDKSWLLIQGLAQKRHAIELSEENAISYGAPPLLAEKARQGEIDAVLNFWNYCARLEALGFRRLVGAKEAGEALGASGPVAALGYVFHESWAKAHRHAIEGFIAASADAKSLLEHSDAEWRRLAPIIQGEESEQRVMRDRYREGIPKRPVEDEEKDAGALYAVLAQLGGEKLVGPSRILMPGTFWGVE
ncbi:MAG: ABC transporter substrate-binding protein [Shinella sp.]|nr:ABC transporter substrate-binding protein [Shinella sp.]